MSEVWRPQAGPQTEALRRSESEVLFGGARGGGKTEAGLAWLAEPEFAAHPRARGLVLRKNADDLKDWISRARHFYRGLAEVVGKPVEIRFKDGATVVTGHLNDDKAYGKYHGHEYQKILVEELTQIPSEDLFLKIMSTNRSTIEGLRPQFFGTTNPGGRGHGWVKRRWVDPARGKPYRDPVSGKYRIFIPSTVFDNSILVERDPDYVNYLKSLPEKLRQAWLYGNWDVFEGQFFDDWNADVHVVQPFEIPDGWLRFVAIDYGTAAPFCALWLAVDFDGNVWCYREAYATNLNATMQAELIQEMTPGHESIEEYICDPSMFAKTQTSPAGKAVALRSIADYYADAGIDLTPANNNRLSKANVTREYLHWKGEPWEITKQPRLRIFKTCVNLVRTLPEMVHDEKRPEDVDTDGEDHAYDALSYGLLQIDQKAERKKPKRKRRKSIFDVEPKKDHRRIW